MEQLWIFEGDKRRRAEKAICANEKCRANFLRRVSRKPNRWLFCSPECAQMSRKIGAEVQCAYCQRLVVRTPSKIKASKSGLVFCNRACKEAGQRVDGVCPEIRPAHYGTSLRDYRSIMAAELLRGCSACHESAPFKLTVHHINGKRDDNDKANLEVVCWNCHSVRHMRLQGDEWVYDTNALTPRDIVEKFDKEVNHPIGRA